MDYNLAGTATEGLELLKDARENDSPFDLVIVSEHLKTVTRVALHLTASNQASF